MYRSFGFVDMSVSERYSKNLSEGTPSAPAPAITFRELRDEDGARVSRWVDDYCAEGFFAWHLPPWHFSPLHSTFLAEKDDKLIGVACGSPEGEDRARLNCLCVEKDTEKRQDIALTLLALLHRKLAADGIGVIQRWDAPQDGLVPETLFVIGLETPFEGYLQTVTTIEPWMNERVLKLLETLFPKVAML